MIDPRAADPLYVEPDPPRVQASRGCFELLSRLALCGVVLGVLAGLREPASSDGPDSAASPAIQGHRGTPDERDARPAARGPSAPARHDAGVPQATGELGPALVGGWASWYDVGPGRYAAAGPLLRDMLGPDWRGSVVTVQGPGGLTVTVPLVDFCACGTRHDKPTFIDLSRDAFAQLADPSLGIVAVSIEVPAQLPRTDAE